jgi:hypothetical protein
MLESKWRTRRLYRHTLPLTLVVARSRGLAWSWTRRVASRIRTQSCSVSQLFPFLVLDILVRLAESNHLHAAVTEGNSKSLSIEARAGSTHVFLQALCCGVVLRASVYHASRREQGPLRGFDHFSPGSSSLVSSLE